ncbi:MAG: hypothetical protein MMC33_002773 [Icmadophila ericetorum]|nr:hypothetical protein [Icmadophila ericetorum]
MSSSEFRPATDSAASQPSDGRNGHKGVAKEIKEGRAYTESQLQEAKEALQDEITGALEVHFTLSKGINESLLKGVGMPPLRAQLATVERYVAPQNRCLQHWDDDGKGL